MGKYVLNKEAFKENRVSVRVRRCMFRFTEGYHWYFSISFLGTWSSPNKLLVLPEYKNECLCRFNIVDNSKSSGWEGH